MSFSRERVEAYIKAFRSRHTRSPGVALSEGVWSLQDHELMVVPRNSGDCRYPYGTGGYNLWTYASGYIHANEGLFNIFPKAGDGQDPRLTYHARYEIQTGKNITFPLLSVPCQSLEGLERFAVFGADGVVYGTLWEDESFGIHVTANDSGGFNSSIEYFPAGDSLVHLRQIMICVNPGLTHDLFETGETRWFRKARFQESPVPEFHFYCNEDISRTLSVTHTGILQQRIDPEWIAASWQSTCAKNEWCGSSHRNLSSALCLETGRLPEQRRICTFSDWALAGTIITLKETAPFTHVMEFRSAVASECPAIPAKAVQWKDPAEFSVAFTSGSGSILSGDALTAFVFHLRRQVDFCAAIKGFVQLSHNSLIGIRDVFQALEASTWWDPETSTTKIVEALGTITEEGRCPRQYSLPRPDGNRRMDLRPFVDQGNWVISAIVQHVRIHGDFRILGVHCGFINIIDEDKKLVQASPRTTTVFDHMVRIMDWLEAQRDHEGTGCLRALYGDWNDALDGLGVSQDSSRTYGSGVSVMASLHYYRNLSEMEELCRKLQQEDLLPVPCLDTLISRYHELRSALAISLRNHAVVTQGTKSRILHGWGDQKSYTVGGYHDVDGKSRNALASTAFWVLCGMYDSSSHEHASLLEAFDHLSSPHGLKTFHPGFEPNCPGVGRIPKLPMGTAENGAVYVHASLFGVWALFRMDEPERAWAELILLLPYLKGTMNVSPFVMPNSYGLNNDLLIDGESMQDWQTGSSNVLMKILIGEVLGVQPDLEGCRFAPAKYNPFESMELHICLRGAPWVIRWKRLRGTTPSFVKIGGQVCHAGAEIYLPAADLGRGGDLEFWSAEE